MRAITVLAFAVVMVCAAVMPGHADKRVAFEVKKLTGQRAALPEASSAQFRERALSDALANGTGFDRHDFGRLREGLRIGPSGPSRLGEDPRHRRFEHGAKCAGFVRLAHLFQTNGRINLLLRDGGLRLAADNPVFLAWGPRP